MNIYIVVLFSITHSSGIKMQNMALSELLYSKYFQKTLRVTTPPFFFRKFVLLSDSRPARLLIRTLSNEKMSLYRAFEKCRVMPK